MSKYINLDDYCKNICKCNADSCDKEKCPLWTAPTADVVEVLRCKDCKYGNKDGKYIHCQHFDSGDSFVDEDFNPDDFCSYGQRKRKIKRWNT